MLEERGRKSQGKSCLLLAVAGATSLVTLLLAVPITVLAVLILVPQEQEGLVSDCNTKSVVYCLYHFPLGGSHDSSSQMTWLSLWWSVLSVSAASLSRLL